MMKVKLLRRMAGPGGNYAPKTILDLDERLAIDLVGSGSAEYAEPEPPEETTEAERIMETTEQPKPRRGRPRKNPVLNG